MYKFKTEPWPHQLECFEFAIDKEAVGIFMDMGTGKTKVATDVVVNREHQKILTVCPKRVIKVWPRQVAEHADGINVVPLIKGTATTKSEFIKNYNGPFPVMFVMNYDIVWREPLKSVLRAYGFDCVILDEGHRIKKPGGKASQLFHLLGKSVPYRMLLTGTPIPHSPLDVYAMYRFLDQSIFGTNFAKFKDRYCVENKFNYSKKFINQEELSDKMYSIAFRVKARDVLDLPEPIEQVFTVDLPSSIMGVYKLLEKESVLEVQGGLKAINNVLAQNTRMHQLSSGLSIDAQGDPIRLDNSKQTMFADILEDLDKNEPIVVFARFTPDLDAVREVCEQQGRAYAEVSGRRDDLDEWKAGEYDVVGVQIQSGSEGEDYTRSHYTIYYSHGLSLKDYQQSRARTDRPGQMVRPMFIHIIANKTVDVKILKALRANKEIADYIVDDYQKGKVGEDWEEENGQN